MTKAIPPSFFASCILVAIVCVSSSVIFAQDAPQRGEGITEVDTPRPNILFIIADDASRDSFGAYGSSYIKTPAFDQIARDGVTFTQAYNCNPKCSPARACLLTGRYSWQLEEACNHYPTLSAKWKFYPYLLEAEGYRIGYTGKGWGPGKWLGQNGEKGLKANNPAGHQWNKRRLDPPYEGIANIDYAGNFQAFLDAAPGDRPFCFWLGTKEPHRAYGRDNWKLDGRDLADVSVPQYWPDNEIIRGDLADYAIEVEWFDKHIGLALKHLETAGKLDNTLVIATSDHGMPFPRVKGQVYDDGFHVPLVARWGNKIKAGRTVSDFVSFPDLAPTLMEVARCAVDPQMTGQSFAQQLLAEKSGRVDPSRDHTLLGKERHDIGRSDGDQLSVGYPVRAIRNDQFLYVRNFLSHRWPVGDPKYGLRNCDASPTKSFLTQLDPESKEYQWYQMSFGKRPEEELYDMTTDPDCVHNLADDPNFVSTKNQLWAQLSRELKQQGDPRAMGKGEVFDYYPYANSAKERELYDDPDFDPAAVFQAKFGTGTQADRE